MACLDRVVGQGPEGGPPMQRAADRHATGKATTLFLGRRRAEEGAAGVCKINARESSPRFSKMGRPPSPPDFNVGGTQVCRVMWCNRFVLSRDAPGAALADLNIEIGGRGGAPV